MEAGKKGPMGGGDIFNSFSNKDLKIKEKSDHAIPLLQPSFGPPISCGGKAEPSPEVSDSGGLGCRAPGFAFITGSQVMVLVWGAPLGGLLR